MSLKTIHLVLITYKIIRKNTVKTSNIEKHPDERISYIHQYEFDENLDLLNCLNNQFD